MVGLFHDGFQFRRSPARPVADHLEGRVALFRPAGQPDAYAADLGEAEDRNPAAGACSLPAQRRFFGAEAPAPMAVEPCPGRRQVVVVGTAGLPAAARPAGDLVLRRAQYPDAAGDRADVEADRPA